MDWAEKLDDLLQKYIPQMKVIAEEPMSRHTTFRIGEWRFPAMARKWCCW